ncbi:MAG: hypothetical protein Q4D93_04740 [Porphyromonas sp.]|nr:hypothetical protein [Porphyromonas sp.]
MQKSDKPQDYKQRLEERRALLQTRADMSQAHIEQNIKLLADEAPAMLKAGIAEKVSESGSRLMGTINSLLGVRALPGPSKLMNFMGKGRKRRGRERAEKGRFAGIQRKLSSVIIPLFYTVGFSKLLSLLLRGSGTLIRSIVLGLFFRGKKKK